MGKDERSFLQAVAATFGYWKYWKKWTNENYEMLKWKTTNGVIQTIKTTRIYQSTQFLVKARKVGGRFKGRENERPAMRALHEEPGNAWGARDKRMFPLPANGTALTEREPISMAAS